MESHTNFKCCALGEIHGLSETRESPEEKLKQLFYRKAEWYGRLPATGGGSITLFTSASNTKDRSQYAQPFADYITKNGLGNIVRHRPVKNRNTGNYVTLYVWFTDAKALSEWWAERKAEQPAFVDTCGCGNPRCDNNQP